MSKFLKGLKDAFVEVAVFAIAFVQTAALVFVNVCLHAMEVKAKVLTLVAAETRARFTMLESL